MTVLRGLLHAAIISLLYIANRYQEDVVMFWICITGVGLFVRKLYILGRTN